MKIEIKISDKSLLEACEELGHDVEYQCRRGYCGSCAAEIIEGKVEYFRQPTAFAHDGQVFLCCAKAIDRVVVAINE